MSRRVFLGSWYWAVSGSVFAGTDGTRWSSRRERTPRKPSKTSKNLYIYFLCMLVLLFCLWEQFLLKIIVFIFIYIKQSNDIFIKMTLNKGHFIPAFALPVVNVMINMNNLHYVHTSLRCNCYYRYLLFWKKVSRCNSVEHPFIRHSETRRRRPLTSG